MQSYHAKMGQNVANTIKRLQIQGTWYQERKQKKNKTWGKKIAKTILHPFYSLLNKHQQCHPLPRRQLLTGLSDAEKAIVADAAKGRAAEATVREDEDGKMMGRWLEDRGLNGKHGGYVGIDESIIENREVCLIDACPRISDDYDNGWGWFCLKNGLRNIGR